MGNTQIFRVLVGLFAICAVAYLYVAVVPTMNLGAVVASLPGASSQPTAITLPTSSVTAVPATTVAGQIAVPVTPTKSEDPAAVLFAFDHAMSAGNVAGALALFANDAVLITPDGTANSLADIATTLNQFAGQHILFISTNPQISGNTETYVTHVSSDDWQAKGVTQLDATGKLVVQNGKISSLTLDYSESALAPLPQMASRPGVLPKGGELSVPASLTVAVVISLVAAGVTIRRRRTSRKGRA